MSTYVDLAEVSPVPAIERRGIPRQPLLQRCLVWPPDATGAEGWRCIIHNISANGIGLSLWAGRRASMEVKVHAPCSVAETIR